MIELSDSVLCKLVAPGAGPAEPLVADRPAPPINEQGLLALVDDLRHQLTDLEQQRQRLFADYHQLEEQIRLACQVQRELLPEAVTFPGLEIRTLYRPANRVSGDMYDIARLDETHLGISLADASGHGMPAALLTVLLKRAFRGKEIRNGSYRVFKPADVLRRVNRDILETNFKQCQFVTGLHAVYHEPQRILTFARGGLPYPVLLRAGQFPRQLVTAGPLIGAFEGAHFETMNVHLSCGDTVLLYTDGLEALLLERTGSHPHVSIDQTPWFAALANRPMEETLGDLERRLDQTAAPTWPADDLTIIAIRVVE